MTKQEFNDTVWGANMFAKINGDLYPITGVDFETESVEIKGEGWVKAHHINLASAPEIKKHSELARRTRTIISEKIEYDKQ